MEKVANCRIMTITALSSIGKGPRNFTVNEDAPTCKNKAAASSQNAETKPITAKKRATTTESPSNQET